MEKFSAREWCFVTIIAVLALLWLNRNSGSYEGRYRAFPTSNSVLIIDTKTGEVWPSGRDGFLEPKNR